MQLSPYLGCTLKSVAARCVKTLSAGTHQSPTCRRAPDFIWILHLSCTMLTNNLYRSHMLRQSFCGSVRAFPNIMFSWQDFCKKKMVRKQKDRNGMAYVDIENFNKKLGF
jgi:hypothetical protein